MARGRPKKPPVADLPREETHVRNGAGDASQNEGPSPEERSPELRVPVAKGPQIDKETGSYGPAAYPAQAKVKDGKETVTVNMIREDR
jgi:hypothetical protein